MASLVKKVFETMPLVGATGAVYESAPNKSGSTMGMLRRWLDFPQQGEPLSHQVARPSPELIELIEEVSEVDRFPIWGWEASGPVNRVDRIACRVRDDRFNNYLVLQSLVFGHAPPASPKSFRSSVLVVWNGTPIELPLTEEFRLMTFVTSGGYIPPRVNTALWPIECRMDPALLHVFVYNLHRTTKELVPLKAPKHPQRRQVDAMLTRLEALRDEDYEDSRPYADVLFADDLWDTALSGVPPTGTVPENVDLSLGAVRIVVACSLTPCREINDYQPGGPASVGRLFPHVMVASTAPLNRAEAGVRFRRPATMTLLDGGHCSCDEMLSDIQTLLSTDSNATAMVMGNAPGLGPVPHWANLFNYYVTDPLADANLKDKAIPVVQRPTSNEPRNGWALVSRDCSDLTGLKREEGNDKRVHKVPGQGQFDNIHIAPHMKVKTAFDRVVIERGIYPGAVVQFDKNDPKSYEKWKMHDVVMAPFCAHDCFHMHWRWSDNANTQPATYGWGTTQPNVVPGGPMVPLNQDVFLAVTDRNACTYLAQAYAVPKNEWVPFCHHGGAYAVAMRWPAELAKSSMSRVDGMRFQVAKGSLGIDVLGEWALFYWRMRYRLKPVPKWDSMGNRYWEAGVEERFSFKDEAGALER